MVALDDSYAPVSPAKFTGRGCEAPVAQLDRAPDYESGGQEFESLRARQQSTENETQFVALFLSENGPPAKGTTEEPPAWMS